MYNGFVEATCPLLGTFRLPLPLKSGSFSAVIVILCMQKLRVDWDKWGELWLTIAAFVDFGILLFLSLTNSLYVMYGGYIVFRVIYQAMITIAQ